MNLLKVPEVLNQPLPKHHLRAPAAWIYLINGSGLYQATAVMLYMPYSAMRRHEDASVVAHGTFLSMMEDFSLRSVEHCFADIHSCCASTSSLKLCGVDLMFFIHLFLVLHVLDPQVNYLL